MIKDTDKKISSASYVFNVKNNGSGASGGNKQQRQDKQNKKSLLRIFAEIDNQQIKPQTNPFEIENNEQINLVQEYFNKKFYKIKKDIDKVYFEFGTNGEVRNKFNEILNFSQKIIFEYFNSNKTNINGISYVYNEAQRKLSSFDMKFSIFFDGKGKVDEIVLEDDYRIYSIKYSKQTILNKILMTEKRIEKYCLLDKTLNVKQEWHNSLKDVLNKYSEYKNNNLSCTIFFEKADYTVLDNYMKNKEFQISSYLKFENNNKIEELKYIYGLPLEYREFNPNTQRVTKLFNLQGISAIVSKYTFFDAVNGQIISSDNLM